MDWYLPDGSTADGPWSLSITPERANWRHAGLRILTLEPGGRHTMHTGPAELIVLPLAGAATVDCAGAAFALTGRRSVFDGVSDFCYVPRGAEITISSATGGRFALPFADARCALPARYGPAAEVPIEVRGAGVCSRQVNGVASADGFACDRLIVVEVLTPGGNWSSYPPHKHDEQGPDESALEEIYYFEVAQGGTAYQRVSASSPDRPIDVLVEVHTGDTVLVPYGWHGPTIASPGRDLYYLNVMAGPAPERAWRFRDHPDHAWVRESWGGQRPDPRLPLTTAAAGARSREVFVLVGDGSYLMMALELVTAVAEGVKLIVVLVNNDGYASIGALSETVGVPRFGTWYRFRCPETGSFDGDRLPVDLAANAASLGADVIRASTVDDFAAALEKAKASSRTTVVYVETDPMIAAPSSEAWWDVPVAAVSTSADTERDRAAYITGKQAQRPYL